MRTMKKWLFIFLFCLSSMYANPYLFVLFDAGETLSLKPVIERLKEEGKQVDVVALGTAPLFIADAKKIEHVDKDWDRNQSLSQKKFHDIFSSYKPETVVIGVASVIQKQVAEYFHKRAQVIGYYDNFGSIEQISYASLVREIEKHLHMLLTASSFGADSSDVKEVHVVGNPDVEIFGNRLKEVDVAKLKKRFKIDEEARVITYVGGYGNDDVLALKILAEGMRSFPQDYLIVCPHPKTDGTLEKRYLPKGQFANEGIFSTEGVALADIVVCHRSTLGIKSIMLGKRVIFIDPFLSPSITAWSGSIVKNAEEFIQALKREEEATCPYSHQDSAHLICHLLTHKESKKKGEQ